jgi:uncharacterized protein (TIGR00297 family)
MPSIDWTFIAVLILCMALSVLSQKLTLIASLAGGVAATCIFIGAGYSGIVMLATFFISGSAATSWKMNVKQRLGFAERNKGRRKPGQVLANGSIAAIAGLLIWFYPPYKDFFIAMMAASLASAKADTLSSELGTVYGKKFYNIIAFKKDTRGLDGVISLEGTLIGFAGSAIIAVIYSIGFGWNKNFAIIIIAGTIGNIADSVLGALLERKNYLSNNAVNFLNTLIAAAVALLCLMV